MQLLFRTKQAANAAQEAEFLALSPQMRAREFLRFTALVQRIYPKKDTPVKDDGFILHRSIKVADSTMEWNDQVPLFMQTANEEGLRMIMVGGGAVYWHGYKRHSAGVDFWIETTAENMDRLLLVLRRIGFELERIPPQVLRREQNVSLKFSPVDLDVELITRFSVGKTFDEAYRDSETAEVEGVPFYKWQVLAYDDLVKSKIKAGRPKDLLDIQELKRIRRE